MDLVIFRIHNAVPSMMGTIGFDLRKRCLPVVAVLGLAVGGCVTAGDDGDAADTTSTTSRATTTTTATTVSEPWGHEAVDFFEALRFAHSRDIDSYYAPSAVIEVPGASYEGRDDILGIWDMRHYLSAGVERVFLSSDRAALDRSIEWAALSVVVLSDDGIVEEVHGNTAESYSGIGVTWEGGERLEALYESYVVAWDSGDEARIAALYQSGAVRTDGLFGETRPIGEAGDGRSLGFETLVGDHAHYASAQVGMRVPPVHSRTEPAAAIFAPEPTAFADGFSVAYAMFDITGDDCGLRLLAVWELEDSLIADEEVLYEVSSLRRCADRVGLDLPDGWWTGLEVPVPFAETVTGQVSAHDGDVVDIVNGSAVQERLAEWGLGRFEAAGLAAPQVATIAFPPTQLCAQSRGKQGGYGHGGFASLDPTAARIDLCFEERDVCASPACDPINAGARLSVLHELGHVWENQHVDQATRQAFLKQRNLTAWRDPDTPWFEQGSEVAADTIAWGLMDQPIVIRVPNTTPEEMAEAFRLLTGTEALNTP